MKFYTCGMIYQGGKPQIEFWGYEGAEKRRKQYDYPFPPYFFIKKEDYEKMEVVEKIQLADARATFQEGDYETISTREPLVKVQLSDNRVVQNFLDDFELQTYEADLIKDSNKLIKRFMIDYKAEIMIPPNESFLYWDIETDPRKGIPDPYKAEERIICICAVNRAGEKFRFSDDDEVELIKNFLRVLQKHAVFVDWYGNSFDYPYLQNRCKRLGISFNWRQVVHVDLRAVYKDVLKKKRQSFKLDDVAMEELGRRKLYNFEKTLEVTKLWDFFLADKKKLEDYCLEDAVLVKELDEKYEASKILFTMASVSHARVEDLVIFQGRKFKQARREVSYYAAIDSSVLSTASEGETRKVWPTVTYGEEEGFVGPLVFPPVPGVHKNVVVLDFHAMHLSIIDTFNMGLDTFCPDKSGDIIAPHGSFVAEPKSIYIRAIARLRSIREEFKDVRDTFFPGSEAWKVWDSKQFGVKQLTLSLFGCFGYAKGRHYRKEIAEDITLICQVLQIAAKNELEKIGYKVCYGDSDSMFITFPDNWKGNLLKEALSLADFITGKLREFCEKLFNVKDFKVELEVDKIYSHLDLSEAKKKYIGILIWKGGNWCCMIDAVGYEAINSSWPKAAQKFQKEMMRMKLTGEGMAKIRQFCRETKKRLFAGELDEGLAVYKGISKDFSEYAVEQPQVRVAKKLVKLGVDVRPGDKVGYIVVGDGPDDLMPVYSRGKIKISPAGYSYIWKHYFAPLIERAGVDYANERKLHEYL